MFVVSMVASKPDKQKPVYFGASDVRDMFLKDVTVSAGATYYWKIITKEIRGNKSDPGLFQFPVN